MRKHEERCTLNPQRKCGVCAMMDEEQPTMAALLEPFAGIEAGEECTFDVAVLNTALAQVRNVANCPACIMAAIRQSGIPVPVVEGFNFTEEMRSIWADFNDANSIGTCL